MFFPKIRMKIGKKHVTIRAQLETSLWLCTRVDKFRVRQHSKAAAAKHCGIDIVVTRNKAGFANSGLQVYSPEEFLAMTH